MADTGREERILTGISGSPGICIGKAYIVDREGVNVIEKYYIKKDKLQDEIRRFKAAVKTSKDQLASIIKSTSEELREHVDILETHMALYNDKMLYGRTIETIEREMVNAEWALKTVVSEVKVMFQSISDPYLKGRATDIAHVSDRIMRNLVGAGDVDIAAIDKRVILVARDLSPADTSQIQLVRVKGFITDLGGKTSHTGIIARTLGIPSVLGLENATSQIKSDDIIIVDGRAGIVILHPTDKTIALYEDRLQQYEEYRAVITRSSLLPAKTADGVRLYVMGNIELPEEVVSVMDHGGDGVGLFRTEFLYLRRSSFPSQEELYDQYREVVEL
ncbi:MAG: phosphoenolpyruvate--protein phosphotransferase, partial [Desulfobacteraceae bacterium]